MPGARAGGAREEEGEVCRQSLILEEGPWPFPYRNLVPTPPRLLVAWTTNCFPLRPELLKNYFHNNPSLHQQILAA